MQRGVELLESGKTDDAISVFEQSIGLDPANGQTCYYLSEAWLLKGNAAQAEEFNRLAGIYLEGDPEWVVRVMEQKERIDNRAK